MRPILQLLLLLLLLSLPEGFAHSTTLDGKAVACHCHANGPVKEEEEEFTLR